MIFNILYIVIMIFVPLIICLGTVYGVFQDRIRRSKKQIVCTVIADTTFVCIASIIFFQHMTIENEFFYVLLIGAGIVCGSWYLFRCHLPEALFVFFIVKCYMDAIFCISKTIQYYIAVPLISSSISVDFGLSYAVAFIVTAYPMWLFIRKLLRPLINQTEYMKFWYLVWIIPLLYYMIYRFGISPDYIRPELLMEESGYFLTHLWVITVFMSLIVMVKMMLEATHGVEEAEKRKAMERQLIIQGEQYVKIQAGVEYARKLNHDQRHHFLAIRAYAENRDAKGLKKYLDDYQDSLLPREMIMVCENYVINAIAQHMLERAIRFGVKVDTKLEIPANCGFAQSDLVVVIGNLLENAVEACQRQKSSDRFINVTSFWASEKVLAIVVENSYENEIRQNQGVFRSSKGVREGIGINSVKEIAQRYNGVAKFEYGAREKAGVFKASVLLNL